VFDLMTKWIERYRREAEERFGRLDEVLAEMEASTDVDRPSGDFSTDDQEGAAS
jgi:hypothetical protein